MKFRNATTQRWLSEATPNEHILAYLKLFQHRGCHKFVQCYWSVKKCCSKKFSKMQLFDPCSLSAAMPLTHGFTVGRVNLHLNLSEGFSTKHPPILFRILFPITTQKSLRLSTSWLAPYTLPNVSIYPREPIISGWGLLMTRCRAASHLTTIASHTRDGDGGYDHPSQINYLLQAAKVFRK